MSVSCDRCSCRSKRLDDYENVFDPSGVLVLCHACAEEINHEK
jgi:hypothetical protein